MISAIGQDLTPQERAALFDGRCPECGNPGLFEEVDKSANVPGCMVTNIYCSRCPFSCRMTRDFSKEAQEKTA